MYFLAKSGNWCNYTNESSLRVLNAVPPSGPWFVRAGTGTTDDTGTPDFVVEQDAIDFAGKLARAVGIIE